jgi:hypothetical protein
LNENEIRLSVKINSEHDFTRKSIEVKNSKGVDGFCAAAVQSKLSPRFTVHKLYDCGGHETNMLGAFGHLRQIVAE